MHEFFHSFTPCKVCGAPTVEWQGRVIKQRPDGRYLVEIYDWLTGLEAKRKVVTAARVEREQWHFYATLEHMKQCYNRFWSPQHNVCFGGPTVME